MVKDSRKHYKGHGVALVILLLAVCLVFAACGTPAQTDDRQLYDTLSSQVQPKMKFAEELTLVDEETACMIYNVEKLKVEKASVYVSSGAYVDEIALFLAVNADGAKEIKTAAEKRIASQKQMYANYNTEELPKLDTPIVFVKDNLVVLCIGGDDSTVTYLKDILK